MGGSASLLCFNPYAQCPCSHHKKKQFSLWSVALLYGAVMLYLTLRHHLLLSPSFSTAGDLSCFVPRLPSEKSVTLRASRTPTHLPGILCICVFAYSCIPDTHVRHTCQVYCQVSCIHYFALAGRNLLSFFVCVWYFQSVACFFCFFCVLSSATLLFSYFLCWETISI